MLIVIESTAAYLTFFTKIDIHSICFQLQTIANCLSRLVDAPYCYYWYFIVPKSSNCFIFPFIPLWTKMKLTRLIFWVKIVSRLMKRVCFSWLEVANIDFLQPFFHFLGSRRGGLSGLILWFLVGLTSVLVVVLRLQNARCSLGKKKALFFYTYNKEVKEGRK